MGCPRRSARTFRRWRFDRHPSRGTWLGSTAGMVAADALAVAVGALLGTRLPERAVKLFAAGAFVLFGVLLIAQGLGLL
jgi:Ca2+/H+ antiporter, TMEM165/GDT1 family